MAASTISRTAWTDGASGTVIDNAEKNSAIYDPIDSLIANAITFGDTLAAEGLGDHIFSGSGSGGNIVHVRNGTSGTTNKAAVHFGIDGPDNDLGMIEAYTSGFTTSGSQVASGLALRSTGSGGLSLSAEHASGDVRIAAGGTTAALTLKADGGLLFDDPGSPAISGANEARMYYDGTADQILVSVNAGAYMPILAQQIAERCSDLDPSSTRFSIQIMVGQDGVIDRLYLFANQAPSSGNSYTYTMLKNSVGTAMTATISNTDTTATDLVNSFTVAAGDNIQLQCVSTSGVPTNGASHWVVRFIPNNL
jgi:hypothetical protein